MNNDVLFSNKTCITEANSPKKLINLDSLIHPISNLYSSLTNSNYNNNSSFTNTISPNIKNNLSQKNIHSPKIDVKGENLNMKIINSTENLSEMLKNINISSLNDYYEVESNIFKKKIEKLNLRFFWTSEVLLKDNNIFFPYNKLFLILFKEISLYIDEIARLNKQLKLKAKNENYYRKKLEQFTLKEKQYILNQQILKKTQRTLNLLQRTNDKYKIELEKLNKKISYFNNVNNNSKSAYNNKTINSTFASDSINNGQNSVISGNNNLKNYKDKSNNRKKNDIVKNQINLCNEEIKSLGIIEEMLLKYKKNFADKKLINTGNHNNTQKYSRRLNSDTFK